jgi:hypothetical protein
MPQDHMDVSLSDNAGAQPFAVEKATLEREDGYAPVLESTLLAHVHQLNLDYLELLIAERNTPQGAAQLQHLPPRQRSALASLSARALRSIAAMPYTLYSLGFEEEHFWDAVCTSATSSTPTSVTERYERVGDASAQYAFCNLALMHAWHVAATNTMAARVIYAMPYVTARRLATTPLWQIKLIAASYNVLMLPRWPTNPAFWPDLIRFAAMNDSRRLHTTRLLGTQLISAELEIACSLSRGDPRCVPSPRLRARKLQMAPRGRVGP